MAARRSVAVNSSLGTRTPQYHHYTAPKSRSETFVDYLKSVGYELPKHVTPSHLDYMFQPSETELFDCAKFLMGRVKHVVPADDRKRYQTIMDQGRALNKTELSLAIAEEQEVRRQISKDREKLNERMDETRLRINETRSRINQWHHVKAMQQHSHHLHKQEESSERYQKENRIRKIQVQEHELQDQRHVLEKDMTSTLNLLSRALNSTQPPANAMAKPQTVLLCPSRLDFVRIKNEDSLIALLRTASEQYGTGLVGKSEEFDPFEAEDFAKECANNVNDVERLRAVVMYEFDRKIRLTAKLDKYTKLASCFKDLLATAKRIATQPPEIRTRLINEIQKRIQNRGGRVTEYKNRKLMKLRAGKLSELNGRIQVYQNMKTIAKVKENQFFASVSKMLLNQRARIEIGIHLMKRRFSLISDSLESITRVNRQLCRFHQLEELGNPEAVKRRLPLVSPTLRAALSENGIPPSVLCSYGSAWKALGIVERNEEIGSIRKLISEGERNRTKLRRFKEAVTVAAKAWGSLKASLDEDEEENEITSLSSSNKIIKAKLAAYPESQERLVKEAIDWKRSKSEDINEFLQALPSFD